MGCKQIGTKDRGANFNFFQAVEVLKQDIHIDICSFTPLVDFFRLPLIVFLRVKKGSRTLMVVYILIPRGISNAVCFVG